MTGIAGPRPENHRTRTLALALAALFLFGPFAPPVSALGDISAGREDSAAGPAPTSLLSGPSRDGSGPAPQSYSFGASQNWSPYAPPAFTHGVVSVSTAGHSVDISSYPNVTVNQAGNFTIVFNGTWNPAPAVAADRDWIMIVIVLGGRADIVVLESNTTRSVTLAAAQLPARAFFFMPSPIPFVAARSNASVLVTLPAGTSSRLNLSTSTSGVGLASMPSARPVASKAVWFNASGTYAGNGVLSGTQNTTAVVPWNDEPPFAVHRNETRMWPGESNFPGARFFLFHGGGGIVAVATVDVTVWTRGSPESSLFVNATVAPTSVARGQNATLGGVVGNRSLNAAGGWSTSGAAALAPQRDSANCQEVLRLDNGSYRLFCITLDGSGPGGDNYAVESAWSADGITWRWETGTRFERCSGDYVLNSMAIVRLPNDQLRMYYSGQDPGILCGLSSTHISSALSGDQGATWAAETDFLSDFTVAAPSVWSVVPTPNGDLRMYYDSNSGLSSAVSPDGVSWKYEGAITALAPQRAYSLADGSFKLYSVGGLGSIVSQTSANGLSWNASHTELAGWPSDIQSATLIDRSNGSLLMIGYSAAGGIYVASQTGAIFNTTGGRYTGTLPDGGAFARVALATNSEGRFGDNATIPATSALGRAKVQAAGWFGGPTLRTLILNQVPRWAGPAVFSATEDTPLVVDLANFSSDLDAADTIKYNASSPFGNFSGSNISLNYPDGVTADTVTGSLSDGYDVTAFSFAVNVQPVNDAPTLTPNASYPAQEDTATPTDFASAVADIDTPFGNLTLTTDAPGAVVNGKVISFNFSAPGSYIVNVSVFDGEFTATAATTIVVGGVNDGPVLTLQPLYTGAEDALTLLDLTGAVFDEDTPYDQLVMTTNLTGATVIGFNISLTRTTPQTVPFSVTLSDGTTQVTATSLLQIAAVNDPPVWDSFEINNLTEDVAADIDMAPFITDEDNETSTLVFSVTYPFASFRGSELHMRFPEGITEAFLNLTASDGTSQRTTEVRVRINAVNDPPVLTGTPPNRSESGVPVNFQMSASDPDNTAGFEFSKVDGPSWVTIAPGGLLTIVAPQGQHGRVNYTLQVRDAPGLFSEPVTFDFALPANQVPYMQPNFTALPADARPGVLFRVEFSVFDGDGDAVALSRSVDDGSQTVTITPIGGGAYVLVWTPNYTYTPGPQGFTAWLYGNVTLDDSFDTARFAFAFRAQDPANAAPRIVGTIPRISATVGNSSGLVLTSYMNDSNDPISSLTWTIEGNVSAFASVAFDPQARHLTILFTNVGNGSLRLILSDPSHANASQDIFVQGVAPPADQPIDTGGLPWWWLLIVAGGAIGAALAWRKMRGSPAAIESAPTRATVSAAPAQAAAASSAPMTAVVKPSSRFLVEDLFLLYKDGRTIYSRGGLSADAVEDADSVGSMLVAVQDFVRDSFKKGGQMDRMGYGDTVILIERGDSVILAVTVFGEPDREFREMMTDAVHNVEMTYAGIIESWDGSRTAMLGVEAILAPLWQLTAHLTRGDVLLATTAREVQMLSGVEFFQGFVRLKVGVVNNTAAVITNVTVDLDFNGDVLRLQKIEPGTYKMAGAKVNLGVLQSGEKATLAYYFDPQICTSSAIDGSCRFKDHEGRQHIVQMKSRMAEVVCPLFFTKEQANTAMLKRLVENELKQYDVRAYSFKPGPAETALLPLFEAMKSAVMAHDVIPVRSFERRRPYVGEAWFYGKTQVKGYQMVIRVVVDQEKGRAEFFVASTAIRSVTGLLAEMNHTFQSAAVGRFAELSLAPLFDQAVRDEYADPAAVSKMVEGEAAAGENEPA